MSVICLCDSPAWKLFDVRAHCSLSVIYLAGVLRQAGHQVRVLDAHSITSWDGQKMTVNASMLPECDILGMSGTSANIKWGADVARLWPAKVKVVGGRHVTDIMESCQVRFKHPRYFQGFDYMLAGEGDESFVDFCHRFVTGASEEFAGVDGLYRIDEEQLAPLGNPFPKKVDVTKLPTPAYDLWEAGFAKGALLTRHGLGADAGRRLTATLFNSRGCLVSGTKIRLESGEEIEIQNVSAGDRVAVFDFASGRMTGAPVQDTWEREASDVWELEYDNGIRLFITTEHPLWTKSGWKLAGEISVGEETLSPLRVGVFSPADRKGKNLLLPEMLPRAQQGKLDRPGLPAVFEAIQDSGAPLQRREVLLEAVYAGMVQGASPSPFEKYSKSPEGHEKDGFLHDPRAALEVLGPSPRSHGRGSEGYLGLQEGGTQSHEAARGGRQGFSFGETQQPGNRKEASRAMEGWKDAPSSPERQDRVQAKSSREGITGTLSDDTSAVSVVWGWRLLDWPLRIWETSKSRLRRLENKIGDLAAWRVLASTRKGRGRGEGLPGIRMDGSRHLVERDEDQGTTPTLGEDSFVWRKLVSKRFVGKSVVYNITVCPGHNYIANSLLVHNCPYQCNFCSDRNSGMREETMQQVIDQCRALVELGVGAVRIADDVFTAREKRAMAIADILYDHGILFRAVTRVNLKNPNLFKYLYSKGCSELGFGVEHVTLPMLKAMAKGTTPEANDAAIHMAQDAGIAAQAFLIAGYPGETLESLEAMKEWIPRCKPDGVVFSLFAPYPSTEPFERPEKYGVTIPEDCFDHFWQIIGDGEEDPVLDLPTISKRELLDARKDIQEIINTQIRHRDRRKLLADECG